ncbi:MAG: D-alanine--D-alanine ligase [Planctomycetaceae bacterium]|nr:D-alanine--D-alanine ligase [Planctomycetaceae bacterium]
MKIGLTYDLRDVYLAEGYDEIATAEFDRADTIDSLEHAIIGLGHEADRIGHVRQLVKRLAVGDRWDLVFNICEGMHGIAREAQVPALLEAYSIPCTFGDPVAMSICLHKGLTKTLVEKCGVPTPRFTVVESLADLADIDLPFPLFAKPVAEGTGKGISPASCISSAAELSSVCESLLARFRQPVLVETYLSGREFTVGVLGTGESAHVLGTLEIVLLADAEPGAYSYTNKERCEELVRYDLVRPDNDPEVAEAERIALLAWRELNGRDAGRIDLRSDSHGRPNFIEANPLAGLHPEHSDLPMLATKVGMSYQELIREIVNSAATRVQLSVMD